MALHICVSGESFEDSRGSHEDDWTLMSCPGPRNGGGQIVVDDITKDPHRQVGQATAAAMAAITGGGGGGTRGQGDVQERAQAEVVVVSRRRAPPPPFLLHKATAKRKSDYQQLSACQGTAGALGSRPGMAAPAGRRRCPAARLPRRRRR